MYSSPPDPVRSVGYLTCIFQVFLIKARLCRNVFFHPPGFNRISDHSHGAARREFFVRAIGGSAEEGSASESRKAENRFDIRAEICLTTNIY